MSDLINGYVWKTGEKGVTDTKLNNAWNLGSISTDFYASKPTTGTMDPTDQILVLKGSNAYSRITGANISSSVSGSLTLATNLQSGMLGQLSGKATDFVGGDNACHPMPIASATISGDLNKLSGAATDFVGGDNACHSLATSGNALFIKRTGDSLPAMTPPTLALDTTQGLASTSWSLAALRMTANGGGGQRPQIGFFYPGTAASFYFEPTTLQFRYIDSGNTNHILHDDHTSFTQTGNTTYTVASGSQITVASGANLAVAGGLIGQSGSWTVQAGCTFYVQGPMYVQANTALTVQANGVIYIQDSGHLIIQANADFQIQTINASITNGARLTTVGPQAIWISTAQQALTIDANIGLGAGSYANAPLYIKSSGVGGRPGIGFHNPPGGYACYLYYSNDNKFHFIDAGGTDHLISSS